MATQFCKRVHGTKKIRCRSLPCTQAGLVFHRTPEPQSEALKEHPGNPLVVQWLRLDTLTDRSGSIPGQGTKIPQALRHGKTKTKTKTKNTQYRCRDILNSLEATSGASWWGMGKHWKGICISSSPSSPSSSTVFNQECFTWMYFMYEA